MFQQIQLRTDSWSHFSIFSLLIGGSPSIISVSVFISVLILNYHHQLSLSAEYCSPYLSPPCLQLSGLNQFLRDLVDQQLEVRLSRDSGLDMALLTPLKLPTDSPPVATELLSSCSFLPLKIVTGGARNKVFTSLLKSLLSWPRPRGLFGLLVNCCLQASRSSVSLITFVFLLVKTTSPSVLSSSSFR